MSIIKESTLNLSTQWQDLFNFEDVLFTLDEDSFNEAKELIQKYINTYTDLISFDRYLYYMFNYCYEVNFDQQDLYNQLIDTFCNEVDQNGLQIIQKPTGDELIIKNDDIDAFIELTMIPNKKDFLFKEKSFSWIHGLDSLECAAHYGSAAIFKYLLMNDMKISEDCAKYAVDGGSLEIIHILEQKGKDFSNSLINAINYHRQDIADWILLNYRAHFNYYYECIVSFNEEIFLYFLTQNAENDINFTFLQYDVDQFNSYLIQYLLENYDDTKYQLFVNIHYIIDSRRHSPKSKEDKLPSIKFFIDCGMDINYVPSYFSLLYEACISNEYDIASILLENGANVADDQYYSSEYNSNKQCILDVMVCSRKFEIANLLIEHGAKFNDINKLLTYQAFIDNIEGFDFLIDNGAYSISGEIRYGKKDYDLISTASFFNRSRFIEGINFLMSDNLYAFTYHYEFYHAIRKHYYEFVEFFVKKWPYLTMETIRPSNKKHHYTALGFAIHSKAFKSVPLLINKSVINEINYRKNNKFTPLIRAIQLKQNDIAKLLIENGADVNLACNGVSPLSCAILKQNSYLTEYLLISGAIPTNNDLIFFEKQGIIDFISNTILNKIEFHDVYENYKRSKDLKEKEPKEIKEIEQLSYVEIFDNLL